MPQIDYKKSIPRALAILIIAAIVIALLVVFDVWKVVSFVDRIFLIVAVFLLVYLFGVMHVRPSEIKQKHDKKRRSRK